MKKETPAAMRYMEAVFCTSYLIFVFVSCILFFKRGDTLLSLMCLLLGGGDAFHLVPRILIALRGRKENDDFYLGLGNLISSITMTLFYLILFICLKTSHPDIAIPSYLGSVLTILVLMRIILCLFPQNDWFKRNELQNNWHIIRNIPFLIIGAITILYLILSYRLIYPAVLVFLSFLFYMGTVLFARKNPKMGMLMMPKTICYILLILYFLRQR